MLLLRRWFDHFQGYIWVPVCCYFLALPLCKNLYEPIPKSLLVRLKHIRVAWQKYTIRPVITMTNAMKYNQYGL